MKFTCITDKRISIPNDEIVKYYNECEDTYKILESFFREIGFELSFVSQHINKRHNSKMSIITIQIDTLLKMLILYTTGKENYGIDYYDDADHPFIIKGIKLNWEEGLNQILRVIRELWQKEQLKCLTQK